MTFTARFKGVCAEGDTIEIGDEVAYDTDRNLMHAQCSGSAPKVARNAKQCSRCFLVHTGECF